MRILLTRRSWLCWSMLGLVNVTASSCGTLLYPERRGQASSGKLDWKVVGLNGIGLLFFFVPGVIAFAVDFITGAIYLPQDCVDFQTEATSPSKKQSLRRVKIARSELNPLGIQRVIARETGKAVSLDKDEVVTRNLNSIDDFWHVEQEFADFPGIAKLS